MYIDLFILMQELEKNITCNCIKIPCLQEGMLLLVHLSFEKSDRVQKN